MTKTQGQKKKAREKRKQKALNSSASMMPKIVVEAPRVVAPMMRAKSVIAQKVAPKIASHNAAVLGMTLPHAFPTPRLSTVYADVPTAVASPFLLESVDWTSPGATTDRMIPKGSFFMAASRAPLQALVRHLEYPDGQESSYRFNFATPSQPTPFYNRFQMEINQSGVISFPYDLNLSDTIDPQYLDDAKDGIAGFSHPHGIKYYAVDAGGRKGFWVSNANSLLRITNEHYVSPSDMVGTAIFRLSQWDGSTWQRTGDIKRMDLSLSPGSVDDFPIPRPGYWALDIEAVCEAQTIAAQVLEYTIELVGKGPQFGFLPIPKIGSVEASVQSIRTTAVSLMLTQRAAVLSQGGQVTGVQLPSSESWYSSLGSDDPFDTLSNYTGAVTLTLENGMYGFLKPASQPEFDFATPFQIVDEEVSSYVNPIEPHGSWIVIVANVALFTGSYAGGLCHLTASYGVEFVTDNIWFSSIPSSLPPDAFTKALVELKNTQQWHENPLHFKELIRSAMSAGKTALKLAPSIGKLVSQFMPGVNPSIALLESLAKLGHAL